MAGFVAVHIGAGYHSHRLEPEYCKAMLEACSAASATASQDTLPIMATALRCLEAAQDSELVNAGLGSNLSESGHVECDAGAMTGQGVFGAVGTVRGVRNPVDLAVRIALESQQELACGRVPPIFLAGDGAREWALQHGVAAAQTAAEADKMHITAASRKQWRRYKDMLAAATSAGKEADDVPLEQHGKHRLQGTQQREQPASKRARRSGDDQAEPLPSNDLQAGGSHAASPQPSADHGSHEQMASKAVLQQAHQEDCESVDARVLYDTAGCIYVSASGEVAAGVSSGGIAVKADGRVGEAAMYGCGCWAASSEDRAQPSVACSVTGVGELVMRASLARTCCERLLRDASVPIDEVCTSVITKHILQQCHPGPSMPKDCGIIAVRAAQEPGQSQLSVEFAAVHSSHSMGFAFLHPQLSRPSCQVLRQEQPDGQQPSVACFGAFAALH